MKVTIGVDIAGSATADTGGDLVRIIGAAVDQVARAVQVRVRQRGVQAHATNNLFQGAGVAIIRAGDR